MVKLKFLKKMKQFNKISSVLNAGLITSAAITGVVSVASFANAEGLPVGIALIGTSLLYSLILLYGLYRV